MLRVISGSAKGHKLKTIKGTATRPTSDRVKEALFNIIAVKIENSTVLDVFAGTGSLGIEALSRGACSAVFMDKSQECCWTIRENLVHTKLSDKASVYTTDFAAGIEKLFIKRQRFDLILLDPPYNKNFIQEALKILIKNDIMKDDGIIVAEHSTSDSLPDAVGRLVRMEDRKYGDTMISIYHVIPSCSLSIPVAAAEKELINKDGKLSE